LESYIVNIYRRERESNMIVGVVEKVDSAEKQAFQTSDGLLSLLRVDGGKDRRREGRLRLRLPVVVEGVTDGGGYFRDRTILEDISPHGAQFFTKRALEVGASILLIIDPDNTMYERTVNIMRCVDHTGSYEVGVSF
jgi:hypothetical protein